MSYKRLITEKGLPEQKLKRIAKRHRELEELKARK